MTHPTDEKAMREKVARLIDPSWWEHLDDVAAGRCPDDMPAARIAIDHSLAKADAILALFPTPRPIDDEKVEAVLRAEIHVGEIGQTFIHIEGFDEAVKAINALFAADRAALLERAKALTKALRSLTNECWAEFSLDGKWSDGGQLVRFKTFDQARQSLSQSEQKGEG